MLYVRFLGPLVLANNQIAGNLNYIIPFGDLVSLRFHIYTILLYLKEVNEA